MFEVYHHEYTEGKCDECGKEGKIQITDGIRRCQGCCVDWLIKRLLNSLVYYKDDI
ncbi:hypothetical protein [Methanobacterium sp.]|uniref:hypothetical protein n=1 Tax=Methanobacterium sp. TaxID=2164 RepID=UPI0025E186CF|nr:hypothetical protein [Methanobacterium sp.]MBI5459206.1 hypothetical protein [Methanobacterium sp.]